MAYSNSKILTDIDGKPGPQLYDPAQDKFVPATDELASAQLEKLKEIIKNQGKTTVDNFPSDYPDSAALTELQAMKQKQADMDSKLQGIVDGSTVINNQLTGRIVEKIHTKVITVSAGSTSLVMEKDIGEFVEYAVHISTNGSSNPYVVYGNFKIPGGKSFLQNDDYINMQQLFPDDGKHRQRMISDRFKIKGDIVLVNLNNNDTSDWEYVVTLYAYRR